MEKPYICLSQYSQYRCSEKYVYIANQSNGKQMIFDAVGAEWIGQLSHVPRLFSNIVETLYQKYYDTNKDVLRNDIKDFYEILEREGFVSVGKTFKEASEHAKENIKLNIVTPPITDLTIELTNLCNERCLHCYLPNGKKDKGQYMDMTKLKELVDDFSIMGGLSVTLTGGEALLHPGLVDLLCYINAKGLKIGVYSNLIALSDRHLQVLKDTNIEIIQVSLYSITPGVHDMITTVRGSCRRTIRSIELMVTNNLPVRIACAVMKENKNDVIPLLQFANDLGVKVEMELNITPREDRTTDNLEHRLNIEEVEELLNQMIEYDPDYTINLLHRHKNKYDEKFNLSDFLNYPVCTAGHYGLYVTVDGKVTTCPNLQGIDMGNVYDNSLSEIWNKSYEIKKIRKISEGSFEKCINCEASDYCFRCFARNYTETGSIMIIPDYACQIAFKSKQIVDNYYKKLLC